MVTTWSGCRTTNQLEFSVLISNILLSTSSQVQVQNIMEAPVYLLQEPYPAILYISTLEHLKLYNKTVWGVPESDRCDLTIYKWTDFYQ